MFIFCIVCYTRAKMDYIKFLLYELLPSYKGKIINLEYAKQSECFMGRSWFRAHSPLYFDIVIDSLHECFEKNTPFKLYEVEYIKPQQEMLFSMVRCIVAFEVKNCKLISTHYKNIGNSHITLPSVRFHIADFWDMMMSMLTEYVVLCDPGRAEMEPYGEEAVCLGLGTAFHSKLVCEFKKDMNK